MPQTIHPIAEDVVERPFQLRADSLGGRTPRTRDPHRAAGWPGPAAASLQWPLLLLLPVLGLLATTAVLHATDADIAICRLFYDPSANAWTYGDAFVWQKLYDWGPLPGLALGMAGLGLWITSWFQPRIRRLGDAGFFLAALLALGPGLIINGVFKPCLCRPRPHQVTEFGGQMAFVAAWGKGISREGKSFPSGHASMGFYLMAPAFLLYRRRRAVAYGFVALGLASGSAIGLARIAEGDHFPSDVVWAAGLVYLSGLVLVWGIRRVQQIRDNHATWFDAIRPRPGEVSPSIPFAALHGAVAEVPPEKDAA